MRYLPLLIVSAALLAVVVLMTGDRERAKSAAGRMVLAVVVLTALAALLALVAQRFIRG